ncbi:hypothetical protein BEWA_026720 [Theileria equi strain WA]|uniref:Uncharacterized protein n=1 Tax=Theileria equi strain WA TaxID=1537102 RepID=L0AX45_THEEQ|nr:hypothetical protein BEWA_026720 [Theileria equi strain WA]AFZ79823.1 hypothetical protein BEWA_026720 [Theileria equi strain WA]|eukprot:XP_004829489.1 hypothetical protein BEWA_026720 [Theileria equi strain WA]
MSNETDTDSERKLVDIDISQADNSGNYTDDRQNIINFTKVDDRPTKSYKRYTHTPATKSHYIDGIYYGRVKQGSIQVDDGGRYEKKVTVYYLEYDESNALPLIVGLEKTSGHDKYIYYTRINLSTSSRWKEEDHTSITEEYKLSSILPGIGEKVKGLVVLNLSQTRDTYHANGDPNKAPDINADVKIQVTGPFPETTNKLYEKFKHAPTGGISSMRLLSTKKGGTSIAFEDPRIYITPYNEAYIYFWTGDNSHRNPLLLELKSTSNTPSYYTLKSDGIGVDTKWKTESGIQDNNLKKELDKLNCKWNDAHIVKIAEKPSSSPSYYDCPGCGSKPVTVTNNETNDYSYYAHHILGGYFRIFKDKETEQTGITLTGITSTSTTLTGTRSTVYVYWYPKGSEGIPLLIYLQEPLNKWFERESLGSNRWTPVSSNLPSDYKDDQKILGHLKAILPTVSINIGHADGLEASESSTTYPDPSGDGRGKAIKATRKDIEEPEKSTKYVSISHCVDNKSYFMVKQVTDSSNSPLPNIPPNQVVKRIIAYYYGTDFKPEKLLTVGFEKRGTDSNNYEYYSRGSRDSSWTLDAGQNTELDGNRLTAQLKELKEKLEGKQERETQENGGGSGPTAGSRPEEHGAATGGDHGPETKTQNGAYNSVINGIQEIVQKATDFFKSQNGIITAGAVGGGIGTGILGFGTWKLWPKIMSCLITKAL